MALALRLAERGRGQTSPNPMVGAVVVTASGVAAGLGYHQRAGGPHAEILALAMAAGCAKGATLYCTLEPCSHAGRTGPCCVAVSEAGIARVVAAMPDPNPLVAGRGLAFLRERGIAVTVGLLERDAARLNAAFVTAMRRGRPYVIAKMATSADGKVAAARGRRTALTSEPANRWTHRLRAEVDALAIGSQTVLVDDPLLTVRGVFRERRFVRVVFDSRLRTPAGARLLKTRDAGPIVIVTTDEARQASPAAATALEAAGAELLIAPRHDMAAALRQLGSREIRSLVLEGGPTVQRAACAGGLVDHVQAFVTPRVLGSEGVAWDMPLACSLAALDDVRVTPLGPDVLVEGDVHRVD
jgi:diaminohydroxyphosphoribosylaminopyrimidine deaminase/5-amino-6-(5-phosphoribosylamino)uracil reductase